MKFLLVYDLADQSTREVGEGMKYGLTSLGHEVTPFYTNFFVKWLMAPWDDLPQDKLPADVRGNVYGTINRILHSTIMTERPDVLLVISGWGVAREMVDWTHNLGVRTVLYLTESPYQDEQQTETMQPYDLVLLNESSTLPMYQGNHPRVVYMPHSYNPEIHRVMRRRKGHGFDVFMCATGFRERIAVLEQIVWHGIDLRLAGFWPNIEGTKLARYCDNTILPNAALPVYYRSSKINLNIHRTSKVWTQGEDGQEHIDYRPDSLGPRVYEVLACGGFLISDYRAEMAGWLHDGEQIVTFETPAELAHKVRYYLGRPEDRRRIAAAGTNAVAHCTFADRCESILFPALKEVM